MSGAPKIFISAGEASGEHYGTLLIPAIRRLVPQAEFFGLGGQRMETLGFRRIVKAEDVAVMGITEVIRHMPRIYGEYRRLKASIRTERPDAAVLIDFPDVNLSLARHLHRAGVPVIYFVSPQLWAWKKYRIREVQRYVDRMLVIFPFEENFYRERGVEAQFVGHPLAELPLPVVTRETFATCWGLDPSKQWIGLLPGSRGKEIRLNLPEMLRAAALLAGRGDYEFVLPLAATLTAAHRETVKEILATVPVNAKVAVTDDARGTLLHARGSLVASGTATVEAALIGNPFLVVYRVSPATYAVAKRVVDVPHVAMVNLIAEKRLVPELIQDDFTAERAVAELEPLLRDGNDRERMLSGLQAISDMLKAEGQEEATAIDRVARVTSQMLQAKAAGTRD
ncbi:lipid-A-disaccharide synthase [Silvibacterium dinghuense]|uniref:Lipid-A-disaccharide synthase n=1 Tax=Silvibacterium dinghuense TaxID=1560006 RepID=A0A4V1NVQ2_9BACT|nr:lipid-A-disaccharide synthase [Silvibacterium dinghuense]RXS96712.1 lipid-A-disaccharide synthase [Silvibacterium dinghuense]